MEWIISNKEWFLSGIGIAVPLTIISIIVTILLAKNSSSKNQKQKSGNNCTNIQVGDNLNIKK